MEKPSSESNMSATAYATLRNYAANRWPDQNHKGRMRELSRKLGFGARRVRSLYQNEPGVSLRADEMERIEALSAADQENIDDFAALQARVAALEAALFAQDETFHREQMAGYRQALHVGRRADEPSAVE